jgi:predicted PurR-regulated permease PerM
MNQGRPQADSAFIQRAVRLAIIAAAVAGAVLALLWLLRAALTPLAVAFVIAYLFDPLIDRFEARGIGRRLAIFLLLGLVALVLLAFAFLVIPRLIAEIAALSASLPGYFERFLDVTVPRIERLLGITLPHTLGEGLEHLRTGGFQIVLDTARSTVERTVSLVTGTLSALVGALVVPVIAYYVLAQFDEIKRSILRMVPRDYQQRVAEKSAVVDRLVSGFIRGQLIVCLCLGFLYAVGFSAIGVDLAVGIGVAAGMLAIIPYVGSAFALGSASLLCVLEFGVDVHLALVVGWYVVVQTLEGFVLVPRIVGGSIGMHPVTVIVALLIGGDLLGFLGLIVAVPLAAVIQVFVRDGIAAYRRSPLYAGAGGEPEGGAPSA